MMNVNDRYGDAPVALGVPSPPIQYVSIKDGLILPMFWGYGRGSGQVPNRCPQGRLLLYSPAVMSWREDMLQ
jgi:hypothetical protein